MYNNKKVDYAYLLWEDFIYQIENKNTKKGNAMYYPRFTKLIVNFVMAKDPSIPRRNKVNWHYARDDPMFTTINVISRNEDTQLYGTILPAELTNEDIRNSESYKEYYAIALGKIPPKTKASKKKADSDATTKQKPPTVPKEKKGKKTRKGKQKAKELETISEAILIEVEQLKIITKRSRKETHSSHASGSGADEGTGVSPGVPDAPDYDSDDDISWKSSEDDQDDDKNDDDENAQDDDDEAPEDDGDDFIHPKLTTHDDETTHEEESDEDDNFDPIVHTPSHVSSSDDEDSDNEVEGVDVEGEKSKADDILPQVQVTQEIKDTHVTLTPVNPDGQQQSSSVSSGFVSNMLNPNQDTSVDAIFGHNAEATSLVNIPVTAIAEPSLFAPTNRPPTPTPLFTQLQQPPILTLATTPSSSLQNLPDFGSLFGFDNRLKALEDNFSEFKQTNQYAEALSSIPGIVDQYLANKLKEAVDVAVQLKSDRIREEAQAENQQFLDSIDEGMKKVIKEQVKSEVSKITSKIEKLVNEQLESEVLVRSSKEAKTSHAVATNLSELELKKILVDKMEANKSINRPRDRADDDQEPSAGTDRGSKRRWSGKEPESTSAPREKTINTAGKTITGSKTHKHSASQSALVEETMQSTDVFEAPTHQEFETGPTFELMKGTCKSLTELEYFCKEVYKATTEKLDWINPEGRQYPHDLRKPLPLVPNSQGRHVIPFHHFINNDLEYLRGGESSRKYSTSVTKTKAADYGQIKWIEDLGKKRRQFYAFATTRESARDVYSKRRIIVVTKVEIVEWQNYKHLDWITVRRDDDILYKFKEGDFHRLRIQDIEDMLLLLVQGKLTNLNVEERLAFNVSLRMFTRSVVIQRRVEDLQLGVESYQKKLNLTKPDTYRSNLRRRDAYTPYSDPRGFIYENKDKKNRLIALMNYTSLAMVPRLLFVTALNYRLKGNQN
ncbi:hypothetical protein Tco_0122166 [Tanacetum coccineum]